MERVNVKEKIKGFVEKSNIKGKKLIYGILVIAVILIVIIMYNGKEKVNTRYILAELEQASELITAKIHYTGLSEYEDTGIPIINKSDFIMVYNATASVGIDIQKIEVDQNKINKTIYITIPQAEAFDVKVDTSSIKYFDEGFALLNVNEKEDSNTAIALAEQAAKEEIKNMGIVEMANTQAATLIEGLLKDAIPFGYKLEIKNK